MNIVARYSITAVLTLGTMLGAWAGPIAWTSVPAGYTTGSVNLGQAFGGALAVVPTDPTKLYVSVGSFTNQSIARVDTAANTVQTVASGFGSIGGIAVFASGELAVTENFSSDTILLLRDLNNDGDFLDAGEVAELIAPILADNNDFTGAQLKVAPAGNASAIPAGALVVQTADGQTSSELLVVENPLGSPAYRPAGGAFFAGFQYNGGVAFDTFGHVIMGESRFDPLTFSSSGRVYALVNSNADAAIGPGESNILVNESSLTAGLTDLSVSAENVVYLTESSGTIRSFTLPANLLTGNATPTVFAQTDASYLSVCQFDDTSRTFAPYAGLPHARLYVSGYDSGWSAATNLLWIEPQPAPANVADWSVY